MGAGGEEVVKKSINEKEMEMQTDRLTEEDDPDVWPTPSTF